MASIVPYQFIAGTQYASIIRTVFGLIERQFDVTFKESNFNPLISFGFQDDASNYKLSPDLYDVFLTLKYPEGYIHHGSAIRLDGSEDLIATIFYRVHAFQELDPDLPKDSLGRFIYKGSLQYTENNALTDQVSLFIRRFLKEHCQLSNPLVLSDRKVLLSHDLDFLTSGIKQEMFYFFKKPSFSLAKGLFRHLLTGKKIWSNIREIILLERSHGFTSVFYLLPENKRDGQIENADYGLTLLNKVGKTILGEEFEIGLHKSTLNSYKDEMSLLPMEGPVSNRNHYLKYQDIHQDWSMMAEAGIGIDTGFGWSEFPGLRNGYALPFKAWAGSAGELPLTIVPLAIMDTTYINHRKKELLLSDFRKLTQYCPDGFLFSILFHNNHLTPWSNHFFLETYRQLLVTLREMEISSVTINEIAGQYRTNQ